MTRTFDTTKRAFDCGVAAIILTASLPVQAAIALAIRLALGRPVLFRQSRPGRGEEVFELVKFRTMRLPDPDVGLVTDRQRMTRLGGLLRATSLDELPTFWNVLKGDMSLVGPRPLLVSYLPLYNPEQRRRHEVRPGVTGLAQVSGRNTLSWEEKFRLDVDYVDNRSFALDAWILWHTVRSVIRREGIVDADGISMAEFTGSEVQ